jgi:non-ribosomal peptide synthase protein (TIGR01720 family)
VVRIDLRGAADSAAAIERACDELQRGFDLSRGPLVRAAYLDLGPEREPRLLLVAHHLVVDGVSWRILLEDLAALLGDGAADSGTTLAATLPPPTTSFARWTALLHGHARSAALRDQLAYWQRVVASEATQAASTVADVATVSAELDARTTAALLSRAPRAHAAQANDLLLAALALALCRRWQRTSLVVTVEGHGREDMFDGVDLSRTVGWFSTLYPVRLTPVAGDRGATIAAIRDHLRRIPDGGLGYGVLQQLAPGAPLATAVEPAVTFNYLGQFDQAFAGQRLFRIAPESHGRRRSSRSLREAPFVVNAVVHDGVLGVDWEYSRALHDRAEALLLLAAFLDELRMLICHCDELLGATP